MHTPSLLVAYCIGEVGVCSLSLFTTRTAEPRLCRSKRNAVVTKCGYQLDFHGIAISHQLERGRRRIEGTCYDALPLRLLGFVGACARHGIVPGLHSSALVNCSLLGRGDVGNKSRLISIFLRLELHHTKKKIAGEQRMDIVMALLMRQQLIAVGLRHCCRYPALFECSGWLEKYS